MEPNLEQKLAELEGKINAIYVSVEKTRKYFFWTIIITVGAVVLPLIGLSFVIPSFINTYTSSITDLGL